MSQEPVLFKRNIYENILYGKLDALKDEVIDMAKKSKFLIYYMKTLRKKKILYQEAKNKEYLLRELF